MFKTYAQLSVIHERVKCARSFYFQSRRLVLFAAIALCFLLLFFPASAQATTETFTSSTTWTAPAGVTSVTAEVWGAGGGGGGGVLVTGGGGGGGGGAYSKKTSISVTPGNNYTITVGAGGGGGTSGANGTAGGDTLFVNSSTVLAKGGGLGALGPLGVGGSGGSSASGVGDTKYSGGNGGIGVPTLGGGGGGGAGNAASGGSAVSVTAGSAGATGGGAGATGGAAGGNGGTNNAIPGGGGGGGGLGSTSGSSGKTGQVILTYTAALTVAGITASNKTYDGATSATLSVGGAALVGVAGGHSVTLNTGSAAGVFDTATVGTGKTVTVSGLTISGADAGNYTLIQPTTTANVTARSLTVTATDQTKTYGSSSLGSSSFTSSGLQNSETIGSVTLSSNAVTSTSGNYVSGTSTITPSSATGGTFTGSNYSITYTTGTLTVSAKSLTATSITASNKVYDDTTTATLVTGSAALSGVVSGDTVTLNTGSATGSFSDRHVGTGKTVTVSSLTISGADSANYSLTQPTTTADVTVRAITVTAGTESKVYDRNTTSAGVPTVTGGALQGDDTITAISQTFDTKNIGIGKTLTPSGTVTDGNSGNNYSLTLAGATTGTITAKPLTVTGVTASNKVYDDTTTATLDVGSAALSGVVSGDTVTLTTGSAAGVFSSQHIGTGKTITISGLTISGADFANYSLTQPATIANITVRAITVTAGTESKVYDGSTSSTGTPTVTTGALQNDDTIAAISQTFDTKNIGTGKTLTPSGVVTDGNSGSNYTLTLATNTTGQITAKTLTSTGITASSKTYDGTTIATLDVSGAALSGVVGGDTVTVGTGSATGVFDTATVGTGKTVTISGLTISGVDFANYSFTQPTTTADVTAVVTSDGGSGGSGGNSGRRGLPRIDNSSIVNTPPGSGSSGLSTTAPVVISCPQSIFLRSLKIGMSGADVRCLQILLNADVETRIAKSGPGSPGQESFKFGSFTKTAVIKFQQKYSRELLAPQGLTSGTGDVLEATLSKVKRLFYNGIATVPEPKVTSLPLTPKSGCPLFTKWLLLGMESTEVAELQRFLKDLGFLTIRKINGYFGPSTFQAVKDFQFKYGEDILKPTNLSKPTGTWGPQSMKKANQLVGCKV